MRILCLDTFGESALDWLLRCQDDGHQVKWYIAERKTPVGKGLVEVIDDWRGWMRWADLVFLPDNLKFLRDMDYARRQYPDKAIIAPSVEAAAWETDRLLGMKILKQHGIATPPCREFTDYDAAIRYAKSSETALVCKPCGDETDKALSHVAKSPADLVYRLEQWKRAGKLKGSFILQEKISGVEMGVGGWFGAGGFMEGWEENFEFKKLMNGDLGVNTGEQGTVMRFVKKSKLAKLVLEPLAPTLEKMGYVGNIDVNTIIDDDGVPWPLEFTMRPGWPAFSIQQALQDGDHAEWLADLALGRSGASPRSPWRLNEIAVGVVLSVPPYPVKDLSPAECGIPIYGLTPAIRPSIHPCMMMRSDCPQMVNGKVITLPGLAAAGAYVLVATGTGVTVREARDRAYRVLDKIETPTSKMYRTDIGNRLRGQLPKLQAHGFATDMEF